MKKVQLNSSSDNRSSSEFRIRQIAEFWNALLDGGDSGAASWEELEKLEQEVTDCLAQCPPRVEIAESLTSRAMILIAGLKEL